MILSDMDYPTIFKQMYEESEKVEYYEKKMLPKVASLKSGKYIEPYYFYDIVTIGKTNNTYLLYWNISDPQQFYLDGCTAKDKYCLHGNVLLIKDDKGQQHAIAYKNYKAVVVNNNTQRMHGLNVYTPHFFSRYRERFEQPAEYTATDLIAVFSARNLNYTYGLDYNEMVLEKDRIKNGYAGAISDGVVLGEQFFTTAGDKQLFVVKNKTFLGNKNLKKNQSGNVPTKDEIVNLSKRIFKEYYGYDI